MRYGHISCKGAGAGCPEERIRGPVARAWNGLLQLRGPTGHLAQGVQPVAQVVMTPVGPIAGAAQGMVASRVHGFPASGALGPLVIAQGPHPEAEEELPFGGRERACPRRGSKPEARTCTLLGRPKPLQPLVC